MRTILSLYILEYLLINGPVIRQKVCIKRVIMLTADFWVPSF